MSAIEIIEEIKKLPASEQARVLHYLQETRGSAAPNEAGVGYIPDTEFQKCADKILTEHAELFRRLAK